MADATLPTNSQAAKNGLHLPRFSFGVGDRFARQAKPQLRACILAAKQGLEIAPVWNKSHREHTIVGSKPGNVRAAVVAAVRELGWTKPFFVDADHITLQSVDGFLESCDYYTIDVAATIGKACAYSDVEAFVARHPEFLRIIQLPGIEHELELSRSAVAGAALKYLAAVKEAARVYRHIEARKGKGQFVTEVSMDETDAPQSPVELLVILAALADEHVPLETIAPKFTGRFNKGVDYVGNVALFEAEFRSDVAVTMHAVEAYHLPPGLKLSVHSGSDKFSIYPAVHRALWDSGAGVHVKTAGTTWLEELIGLAEEPPDGLALAKEIYERAYEHREELSTPYTTVIDIDPSRLPSPDHVNQWSSEQFVNALRHDQSCPEFNPSFRQLLHVAYKIAAQLSKRYLDMVDACEESIARNVTANLYERHLKPIFLAGQLSSKTDLQQKIGEKTSRAS
jgi:tagaturonate epimerase